MVFQKKTELKSRWCGYTGNRPSSVICTFIEQKMDLQQKFAKQKARHSACERHSKRELFITICCDLLYREQRKCKTFPKDLPSKTEESCSQFGIR